MRNLLQSYIRFQSQGWFECQKSQDWNLTSLVCAYYPRISHRVSLADLQLICKPTVRLCNQRLWVYMQKSFWREPYQTHCRDTFATDLAFQSRCIPTECHRWHCRLISCVQGVLGDFLEFPCPIADWRHALQYRRVPYSELGLELGFRANQGEWCCTMHRNNLSPVGFEPTTY